MLFTAPKYDDTNSGRAKSASGAIFGGLMRIFSGRKKNQPPVQRSSMIDEVMDSFDSDSDVDDSFPVSRGLFIVFLLFYISLELLFKSGDGQGVA